MKIEQSDRVSSGPQAADEASVGPAIERRRPGRRATVSPALLHLLRNPAGQDGLQLPPPETRDLDPVRGIGAAMIPSAALWAIGAAILRLLRH